MTASSTQLAANVVAAKAAAVVAAKAPAKEHKVFFAEVPPATTFMTTKGTPVHFYQGFHATFNKEVMEYLSSEPELFRDVTADIKLEDVPKQPNRVVSRGWHAAENPTEMTPAELLSRVVRTNSATLGANVQQSS